MCVFLCLIEREKEGERAKKERARAQGKDKVRCDGLAGFQGLLCSQRVRLGSVLMCMCFSVYNIH